MLSRTAATASGLKTQWTLWSEVESAATLQSASSAVDHLRPRRRVGEGLYSAVLQSQLTVRGAYNTPWYPPLSTYNPDKGTAKRQRPNCPNLGRSERESLASRRENRESAFVA